MSSEDEQNAEEQQLRSASSKMLSFVVVTPTGDRIDFPQVIASVETIASVKQSLCELQETCFYSNYSLVYSSSDGEDIVMNDFIELSNYMSRIVVDENGEEKEEIVTNFEVRMVPEEYDVKKARAALKRTRDVIRFPPTTKGVAVAATEQSESPAAASTEEGEDKSTEELAAKQAEEEEATTRKLIQQCDDLHAAPATSAEKIFQCPSALGSFYEETLLRGLSHSKSSVAGATGLAADAASSFQLFTPAEIVRGIVISGYNPPPPARAMQGDLMYIECQLGGPVESELGGASNCLHITLVAGGFFVNTSTYKVFDPSPSTHFPNAAFSHELFTTICKASLLFRKSWNTYVTHTEAAPAPVTKKSENKLVKSKGGKAKGEKEPVVADGGVTADSTGSNDEEGSDAGVYDMIGKYYSQGRGDELSQQQSWLVPTAPSTFATAMAATGSATDLGVRAPTSAAAAAVHKYDMSRVQEELCDGYGVEDRGVTRDWNEELQAMRELPAEELVQRVDRSRFMYKLVVEFSEACKLGALAIAGGHISALNPMDQEKAHVFVYNSIFFSRAYDTKETIRLCVGDDACRKVAAQELKNQKLIQALSVDGVSPVLCTLVDYKGERYICQTIVPGILQTGESSARLMYGVLEAGKNMTVKNSTLAVMNTIGSHLYLGERMVAQTPLPAEGDAMTDCVVVNADGEEEPAEAEAQPMTIRVDTEDEVTCSDVNGVKCVPHMGPIEAKILQGSDRRLYAMEMVRLTPRDANFVSTSANGTGHIPEESLTKVPQSISSAFTLRHELVHQYVNHVITTRQKKIYDDWKAEEDASKAAVKAAEPAAEEKTEEKTQEKTQEEKKAEVSVPQEVREALEAITPESLGLKLNVNCYTCSGAGAAGVDAAAVKADEEAIKTLCTHLALHILPQLTERVRSQELLIHDNAHLVSTMHGYGVNVRYLGQLLRMAHTQEAADAVNMANVTAAAAKEEAKNEDSKGEEAKKATEDATPVVKGNLPLYWAELLEIEVIARCTKHIINGLLRDDKAVRNAPAHAIAAVLNALFPTGIASSSVAEKSTKSASAVVEPTEGKKRKSKNTKNAKKAGADSELSVVMNELCITPTVTLPTGETIRAQLLEMAAQRFTAELKFFTAATGVDTGRISGATLTRRVCQVCGLRLLTRDYDFSVSSPFAIGDVHSLLPVVKTSEPDVVFADSKRVLDAARSHIAQQNFSVAYEFTSEAGQWLQQVVGGVHKEYLAATNQISEILIRAGDRTHALRNISSGIALAVQLKGFDNLDTLRAHVQLSTLYQDQKDYFSAVHHLLAAKYIVQLLGGHNHPEIVNIYAKLGSMFIEIGGWDTGLKCLEEAKTRTESTDVHKHCDICTDVADIICRSGMYPQAAELQKQAYLLIKKYYGATHIKAEQSKKTLEMYMRASNEQQKYAVQMHKAQLEIQMREAEEAKKAEAVADLLKGEEKNQKDGKKRSKSNKKK